MVGIALSVIIGGLLGYFFQTPLILDRVDNLIKLGLCLLLFFVGIDIGKNKGVFDNLKSMDKKVILLPFITMIGSLLGGAVASFLTPLSLGESVAISSGMGWYSFSAIELSKISAELGGTAFLSNVSRELLAIFTIPFIATKIGSFPSVATAGAPAIPVINKSNPANVSIIAFYSGFVITLVVPVLVPAMVALFNLG